jgi:hypothetical protein
MDMVLEAVMLSAIIVNRAAVTIKKKRYVLEAGGRFGYM